MENQQTKDDDSDSIEEEANCQNKSMKFVKTPKVVGKHCSTDSNLIISAKVAPQQKHSLTAVGESRLSYTRRDDSSGKTNSGHANDSLQAITLGSLNENDHDDDDYKQ